MSTDVLKVQLQFENMLFYQVKNLLKICAISLILLVMLSESKIGKRLHMVESTIGGDWAFKQWPPSASMLFADLEQ